MTTDTISFTTKNIVKKKSYSPYALPDYLIKHYWWAYLSPLGVNFFDRGFMVNRILWGNYHAIAKDAVDMITSLDGQSVAGISSAYGEFFPQLVQKAQVESLHLFDIAPIQISQMQKKIPRLIINEKCQFFLSDAEHIALQNKSIDTSVLFFLLHELPESVRANVLTQAIRIVKQGGRLVIADYAQFTHSHIFHRNIIFRPCFFACSFSSATRSQSQKLARSGSIFSKMRRKIILR
jgi:ubiquinone/menaquinone biosynthesis C-methylase UbiE